METIDFNAKRGFLCDMDGVIYHGNHILPGAAEFIHWLQDTHKEYLFLTNNSGMTPRELHQKLWRMGLDVPEEHFYTSALATAAFLADVQDMAAMTNYTYDEITGYAKSLVKPFGADKSLDILTTLSDASAALSLNESDNAVLIAGLSRMKLTDKTTQEYLNYFSERGIDVYEALSKWGDAAAVAEKVTRGEIRGSEAVEEILAYMQEQYGGLSEQMAGTYAGMVDNLADAEANAEAAYGEGYNEKRKEGIQAQMDWLNSGAMDEANRAIGAWQAELENTKEQYQREAMEAMMETDEYQQAQAEGDAAEMGRLIMQAKVQGMNEYNASEGAQLALESELALAAAIRDDARSDQAYWDAGYRKSQEYSKGLAAGMASALVGTGSETTTGLSVEERRYGNWRRGGYYDEDGVWRSHAAGLEHPGKLRRRRARVGIVVERVVAQQHLKPPVGKGQALGVPLHQLHRAAQLFPGHRQHIGRQIQPCPGGLRKPEPHLPQQLSRAAAHVQNRAVGNLDKLLQQHRVQPTGMAAEAGGVIGPCLPVKGSARARFTVVHRTFSLLNFIH